MMRVGRNWYLTFNNVNLKSTYGLILSSYETEYPEPKVIRVNIPGGPDKDITDALGPIGYKSGRHVFRFLLYGDTATERKESLVAIETLVNGVRASYKMSWESNYTYTGRAKLSVEHLTLRADLLTIEIERDPWKTSTLETIDVNSHPSGIASLIGSKYYTNVQIVLPQAATVQVGSDTSQSLAAGTHTLASSISGDTDITVTVASSGWVLYTVDGDTDLKVNSSKFSISGTNAVINDTYTITGTDIVFATEALQHSTVKYYRRDV